MVERDGLQAHCAQVGEHLLVRLRELQAKHDVIGDVRGTGLMLGVEMVKDRRTKVRGAWARRGWGRGGDVGCVCVVVEACVTAAAAVAAAADGAHAHHTPHAPRRSPPRPRLPR